MKNLKMRYYIMNIIINENLKKLRRKKGNTLENLADYLNISFQAISKWERGECYPDITLLPKIASYYNVSVDYLLGVGEIPKEEVNLKQIAATLMTDYEANPVRIGAERATKIYKQLEYDKIALESIRFETIKCLDTQEEQREENVVKFINYVFRTV